MRWLMAMMVTWLTLYVGPPWGLPGHSVIKNLPANAGNKGSIPGLGRSPGEGNGNPLQYSCLENPMDGGAWWAAVYGVSQSQTQLKRLSSSSILKIYFPKPWVHILCFTLFFPILSVNLFFCLFVLNQFYCFSFWKIVYLLSWLYKSCLEKFFFK